MNAQAVSDSDFAEVVLRSELPVLVDFWASWCKPCLLLEPVIEELAAEFAGRVRIVKLNTEENPQTTAAFGITSIPALYFFRNGELSQTLIGGRPKPELRNALEALLTDG